MRTGRRQRLHLQLRKGQLHNGIRVGTHGNLHHLRIGGDFGFLEGIPESRRGVWTRHPLPTHICAIQFVHKSGTHTTRLAQELHNIFVRLKRICHLVLHMSHPLLFSYLPFTTNNPPSSFTLPFTTTQEHEAQRAQHEQLREHPVHHAHLQAPSVDKLRHQESLWREDLQSSGNPRTTTPTG